MTYEYATETVGRFIVSVQQDDDFYGWDHYLGDEPVALIYCDFHYGWRCNDAFSNADLPNADFLRAHEDGDASAMLEQLSPYCDETPDGRIWVYDRDDGRARIFKNAENAIRALFREQYKYPFSDLKTKRFDTRSDHYVMGWRQSVLNKYAGVKNAIPPSETVRAVLDGDVWGFTVTDTDGDVIDSCCGYAGDAEYCMGEGIAAAEYLEKDAAEKDAATYVAEMIDARPDLAPIYDSEGM